MKFLHGNTAQAIGVFVCLGFNMKLLAASAVRYSRSFKQPSFLEMLGPTTTLTQGTVPSLTQCGLKCTKDLLCTGFSYQKEFEANGTESQCWIGHFHPFFVTQTGFVDHPHPFWVAFDPIRSKNT